MTRVDFAAHYCAEVAESHVPPGLSNRTVSEWVPTLKVEILNTLPGENTWVAPSNQVYVAVPPPQFDVTGDA